jgi:hypothetical protein
MDESHRKSLASLVHPVTRCLAFGAFATPARLPALRELAVTLLLNVSDGPSLLSIEHGFVEVAWHPLPDFARLSTTEVLNCLDTLHRMVLAPASGVYVHCTAGQNRSPTITWLYLVACGADGHSAKRWITDQAPDAVPGHPALVDEQLVETVRHYGAERFLPLARADILLRP